MEEVLGIYTRPLDPQQPLVCMDEASKQQVREVRLPLPARPGQVACYDSEYERNGVSNLFMFCAPLLGWRAVRVTDQRTARDWAYAVQELVDEHFPEAERITLVMDNLNTHTIASLYATFPPEEAYRLARKLEIHYTPKHGSWLNMAEIELSVLSRQCLARRMPDQATLQAEVASWVAERNGAHARVNWRFTPEEARIKLKRLYPTLEPSK
jgi:DDE superfamily endonuclease